MNKYGPISLVDINQVTGESHPANDYSCCKERVALLFSYNTESIQLGTGNLGVSLEHKKKGLPGTECMVMQLNAAPFQLNKRVITFGSCDRKDVDLLDVKIGTDPPESGKSKSFDISGKLTINDITKDKTILLIAYGGEDGNLLADPYFFKIFTDLIKAGEVAVGDISNDPNNSGTTFGCALATVGESSEKSKIFDIYKLI
ncbi:hypothetical protein C2G38_2213047 [Gigaspora rosea]|uniref:Uncharacterized protein n=1 Tax=Gigaspora rosea TaxID=44941 RepID=A0A397ULB2_9GLOM|nr:hypothetical protein C2G38_2213047 [Gigaspora rosea]